MQMKGRGRASLAFYLPRASGPDLLIPDLVGPTCGRNPDTSPPSTHCSSQAAALGAPCPRGLHVFLKVRCHIYCSTDVFYNLLTEKLRCHFIRVLLLVFYCVTDGIFACWAPNHLFS